ncbi:hypothetical protein VTO42DRAFT_6168 [Malbranchea cinnamomea]
MRIRQFPLSLNVGTDIVHIPRIHRLITSTTYLNRFTRRILCDQELQFFRTKFLPSQNVTDLPRAPSGFISSDTQAMARWLAGRFAAKEAARKAAPGGAASISWKDVMVRVEDETGGRPEVVYLQKGGAMAELGKLSISHDGEYVVATVLAASSK